MTFTTTAPAPGSKLPPQMTEIDGPLRGIPLPVSVVAYVQHQHPLMYSAIASTCIQ